MSDKPTDFEKELINLEKIVQELTTGDLSLKKSMKKFETGVEIYKKCQAELRRVEKKISLLTKGLQEEVFTPDAPGEE